METAVLAPVPDPARHFVERRRAGSVPPRGMVFVERRRPAPVPVLEVEDLHEADLHAVLSDALDYGFGLGAMPPVDAAALLAGRIAAAGPAALVAHDPGDGAAALLAD